jgi:hypothetical protein
MHAPERREYDVVVSEEANFGTRFNRPAKPPATVSSAVSGR